ncbi:major histocompatibility complex class I-related gene protein-like [Alligator sinensis]|uniref:Major histocompatibility complex class I-related gene protein-like n=1 Tax=Alligator sinensis TaxID=38654 RepID=A0A1U7S4L5_ALLSI|nr:major histocompatibility complex class I-related gene protein-like [Alligator sinensis]
MSSGDLGRGWPGMSKPLHLVWLLIWLLGAMGIARATAASAGPHTLQYLLTAVSEPSPDLPEFTMQGYVDGELFVEYDGEAQQMQPRAAWMRAAPPALWESENRVHKLRQGCFRGKVRSLLHLYNQSQGFHIFQYAYGCEIQADGGTRGFRHLGFDGEEFLTYDTVEHRWLAPIAEATAEATQRQWNGNNAALQYYRNFLERECPKILRRYLEYGHSPRPQSKPPKAQVSDKPSSGDGLTTLSCRVHGFYPRDVAVVWLKNGGEKPQETSLSGVIPSGDGTYQIWATIEINPSSNHSYTCSVEHMSLGTALRVAWDKEPKSNLMLIVGIVIAVVLVIIMMGTAVYFLRKWGAGYKAVLLEQPQVHHLCKS